MRLHTSTYKNFGFALVATVSMMVLLTLVAIAMLSLSTIEQRSSGGSANEADRMARANARMALMIAIGELQEAAGPDQRVTATASILASLRAFVLEHDPRGRNQGLSVERFYRAAPRWYGLACDVAPKATIRFFVFCRRFG